MLNEPATTPLLVALRCCTVPEQHEWARLADTSRNYLYQLAKQHRSAGLKTAMNIAKASIQMHIRTTGRIPKLTVEQIAAMGVAS